MSTENQVVDETANFETVLDDMPVIEEVVDTKESDPTSEEKKDDSETKAETKDTTGEDAEPAKQSESKKANGVQKRINEITRQREEAKRENEKLKRDIEALKKSKDTPKEEKISSPKEDDFETYDEYLEALGDYTDKISKQETVEKEPEAKKESEPEKGEGLSDEETTAMAIIKETIGTSEKPKDFDEVALAPDVEITGDMLIALSECEDPAKVMYYLGKNKGLASDIASMSPTKQAMEIGRLDGNVKPPKPTEVSKAPEVIEPVKGQDVQEKSVNDMDFKEYEAWMNKRERGG